MRTLSERYIILLSYKGYDIGTLREANPSEGDNLGYMIDHEAFAGQYFNNPEDAFEAIDKILTLAFLEQNHLKTPI